jgi:hypothetical protein
MFTSNACDEYCGCWNQWGRHVNTNSHRLPAVFGVMADHPNPMRDRGIRSVNVPVPVPVVERVNVPVPYFPQQS